MRKVIKYFLITLLILVIVFIMFIMFIMFSVSSMNEKTNTSKDYAYIVVKQISSYYTAHGAYPKRLSDLDIFDDPEFVSYVKTHSFMYSTHHNNGPKYVLSWRAGAMNWTGYSCTNDISEPSKKENGVVRTYTMSEGTVCTVTDLH